MYLRIVHVSAAIVDVCYCRRYAIGKKILNCAGIYVVENADS